MPFRFELTYSEIEHTLDIKHIARATIGYRLPRGLYQTSDLNLILKSDFPNEMTIKITIDDIRLRSNLTTNKTKKFTKNSFWYTISGVFVKVMLHRQFDILEAFSTNVVGLDEGDIQTFSKQTSEFISYEKPTGFYSTKDCSETIYALGDHKKTLQIEYDRISMETKPILTIFGGTFGSLWFDEKSFFDTLLGFTPRWDFTPNNAIHVDFPGVYSTEKSINLSTNIKFIESVILLMDL